MKKKAEAKKRNRSVSGKKEKISDNVSDIEIKPDNEPSISVVSDEVFAKTSSIDRIKKSFSKGVKEGRSSFLKKLFKIKGINSWEVQNLYSSGLMEPEILRDISIGDLVKLTGIGVGLARNVKSILDRDESDLPYEYEKLEIDKIKKETDKIRNDNDMLRTEIESIDKKYHLSALKFEKDLLVNKGLKDTISKLEEVEKSSYFKEKRIQDEVMFLIKEQKSFKNRIEEIKHDLESSEAKLQSANRELVFTKGECNHILEKINYLAGKLERSVKLKDVSHNKLAGFLGELRCIHDTLVETYKRANVKYYKKESISKDLNNYFIKKRRNLNV